MSNGNSHDAVYYYYSNVSLGREGCDTNIMWLGCCARKYGILAAGLSCCLSPGSLSAAPADSSFRKGLSAYQGGDYKTAMQFWLPLAQSENAPAQAGLGFMYYKGDGVAIDNRKAAFWLRKAAEHGQPEGQFMLGTLYFYGKGVTQSYIQAYAWCDLAQDSGDADASMCRDASLQSLLSNDDMQKAFQLSTDLHHRFSSKR
jgi:TPR repeat protein